MEQPTRDATEWRLTWYPRLMLGALGLALVIVVAVGDGSATAGGRVGGDYPAFYAAGSIVLDGGVESLYEPARQAEAQVGLLGDETGYLAFAYPPHVAVLYAPLAGLPYRISYLVHTGLMVGAVLAALHLIRPLIGLVDRRFWLVAAGALSAYPLFRAVGAGQNTALTLLLMAAVWRGLADDREIVAGVAAGLMLFRPQYGVPVIGLLLLGRHRRAVLVAAGVAGITWLANAAMLGPRWLTDWLDPVRPFLETDAEVNAHNSISWIGFADALVGSTLANLVGGLLAVSTAGVLAAMWLRPRRFDLDTRMAATAAGVVLSSPHALFYDAGLLTLTVLVAADRHWLDQRSVGVVWALTLVHVLADPLGATPLALLVMAAFILVVRSAIMTSRRPVSPRRPEAPIGASG